MGRSSTTWGAWAVLSCLAVAPSVARAEDKPKPPDTPLPAFENPLHDAKVGETLFYEVKDFAEGRPTRYYEERVLAVVKERVLLETVETNAENSKIFSVLATRTGWRTAGETLKVPDGYTWVKAKQKDEVLYVGDPAKKAVRCTHRVLDEPKIPNDPDAGRRNREIWFSHDVPCSGKVKEFPAQEDGMRMAISWDKTLPAAECAERAKNYIDPELDKPADPAPGAPPANPPMDGGEPGMGK